MERRKPMSEHANGQEKTKALIEFGRPTGEALVPKNFEGLWRLANIMHASKMMPPGLDTVEKVFIAVQMGLEVGLTPMQAVQNIAVINGRPLVWGDAGLALVMASGLLEDIEETVENVNGVITATCKVKRKGVNSYIERSFSMEDAHRAGLDKKPGPWQQYPKRMLQMRARWWALRDGFADVLRGLRGREEIDEIELEPMANGSYAVAAKTEEKTEALKQRLQQARQRIDEPETTEEGAPTEEQNETPPEPYRDEADEIISKFWYRRGKGWHAYLLSVSKEEFESWPARAQEAFKEKCKRMKTGFPPPLWGRDEEESEEEPKTEEQAPQEPEPQIPQATINFVTEEEKPSNPQFELRRLELLQPELVKEAKKELGIVWVMSDEAAVRVIRKVEELWKQKKEAEKGKEGNR
jgi:hypothetical protein